MRLHSLDYPDFYRRFGGSARTSQVLGRPGLGQGRWSRMVQHLLGLMSIGAHRNGRLHAMPRRSELPPGFIRLDPWELEYLYMVASRATLGIVEIGRFWGGSTFALACANPRVPIYSIDIRPQDDTRLQALMDAHRVGGKVTLLVGDSRNEHTPTGPFDVLFIDGDHSYEGCAADIHAWYGRLAPGGHVLFHDCYYGMGVQDAVIELMGHHEVIAIQQPYIGADWWHYPAGSIAHLIKPPDSRKPAVSP